MRSPARTARPARAHTPLPAAAAAAAASRPGCAPSARKPPTSTHHAAPRRSHFRRALRRGQTPPNQSHAAAGGRLGGVGGRGSGAPAHRELEAELGGSGDTETVHAPGARGRSHGRRGAGPEGIRPLGPAGGLRLRLRLGRASPALGAVGRIRGRRRRCFSSRRLFVGFGRAEPLRPAAEAEAEELGGGAGRARQVRLPAGGGGGGGGGPGRSRAAPSARWGRRQVGGGVSRGRLVGRGELPRPWAMPPPPLTGGLPP